MMASVSFLAGVMVCFRVACFRVTEKVAGSLSNIVKGALVKARVANGVYLV